MDIVIEKSKIPIIWLDTFFIIECGKWDSGQSDDLRYQGLYKILLEKVYQKKIICVRAEQEEEIDDNIDVSLKKFFNLTLGNDVRLGALVKEIQSHRMMEVYYRKESIFNLFQSDVFKERRDRHNNIVVNVYSKPNVEALSQRSFEKSEYVNELQEFKNSEDDTIPFNERLEMEYRGIYSATTTIIMNNSEKLQEMLKGKVAGDEKILSQFQGLVFAPLKYWGMLVEKDYDLEGYCQFLLSEEHKKIPHIDISSRLITDIMSSPKKWERGDPKDISNLSAYLPYCDLILTDKAQKNRLKRLGLDEKYNTAVFCMNNIQILIEKLEAL